MRIITSQFWAKFLHSADYRGEVGLVGKGRVVYLSYNHDYEVGISEKIEFIEGFFRDVNFREDLEKSINLVRNLHVHKIKNLSEHLIYRRSLLPFNNFLKKSPTNSLILTNKGTKFLSIDFSLIP